MYLDMFVLRLWFKNIRFLVILFSGEVRTSSEWNEGESSTVDIEAKLSGRYGSQRFLRCCSGGKLFLFKEGSIKSYILTLLYYSWFVKGF